MQSQLEGKCILEPDSGMGHISFKKTPIPVRHMHSFPGPIQKEICDIFRAGKTIWRLHRIRLYSAESPDSTEPNIRYSAPPLLRTYLQVGTVVDW